ncbi:MAG: methyltransferase domain-containing protein [Candidatus Hydrogenedentes bacterium]|nr:methyltransferase domain-containing protein [Candidatus Hydrogenedentota bacterium]
MTQATPWYDDDRFWHLWRKWSFTEEIREAAVSEVDQVLALVEARPGAAVLDLCCGPGRHSIELARRGFAVTGVDRCRAYIDEAAALARAGGLDVEMVCADMRAFRREGAFDVVLNLFTAFGYFEEEEENTRVLANVFESLAPGGVFVLEVVGKEPLARNFRPRDWTEKDGIMHLRDTRVVDAWRRIENRWIWIDGPERHEFAVSHWIYSARELSELLRAVGFGGIRVCGDLGGAPYDHEARRLVAVARKE